MNRILYMMRHANAEDFTPSDMDRKVSAYGKIEVEKLSQYMNVKNTSLSGY